MFWNSAVDCAGDDDMHLLRNSAGATAQEKRPCPSFAGFLYLSAGLALIFAALQQGQRLDWWRSGVFNAWFWSGSFFLLCALVRRLRAPNPLVALPYLLKWNTILLGCLLFWFRFTLCTTIILIPQSLAIRGFEADQIGPAIIWSALPLIPIAFIAALLAVAQTSTHACSSPSALLVRHSLPGCARSTRSAWAAENFYRTELLVGVGQAFAFIGLVGCIVLQAIFTGGLAKPEWVLTFSAFFHVIRIFGGTAGAIYMGHFIAQREKLHSNLLGLHVSSGNWITDQNIHAMTAGLYAKSSGMAAAGARAIDLIAARLRLQAYSLSLVDGFLLIAWSCACALILVALLRKSPLNYGDLSAMQQIPGAGKEVKSMKRNAALFVLAATAFSVCIAAAQEDKQYGASAAPHYTAGSCSVGAQAQPRYSHRRLHGRGESSTRSRSRRARIFHRSGMTAASCMRLTHS